uniref:ANKLE2 third alpha/beta domain-containing protein n=1 Tax=Glossina brevipalpis TaxID=37001 RepID=A0A1A9WMS3_9MUSC
MPFYSLYVPVKNVGVPAPNSEAYGSNATSDGNNDIVVFRKKSDALDFLKKHKDGRLKAFHSEDEAMKYAQTGEEIVRNKCDDGKAVTIIHKKSAFPFPTKLKLTRFRKIIESGDCKRVKHMIWDNPRYLVSSGDTPRTLKEEYRYNAMHICAMPNQHKIAELILKTVSDPNFAILLIGKTDDQKMCGEFCRNLLDYYLNIPESGRSETPLHLAAKNGYVKMVEVLTSYSVCKLAKNNKNLLPSQIICSGMNNPNAYVFKKKIQMLLEERFYVPVLRCNDGSMPAQIGQPFSSHNPPNLNNDPFNAGLEVKAIAGPMGEEQAHRFFRRWKTPPRNGSNITSPVANNIFISPKKFGSISSSLHGTRKENVNNSLDLSIAPLKTRSLLNVSEHYHGFDKSIFLEESLVYQQEINDKMKILEDQKAEAAADCNHAINCEGNNNFNNLMGKRKREKESTELSLQPGTPLLKMKKPSFLTYRDPHVASPATQEIDTVMENKFFITNVSDIYDTPGFKERHIKNIDAEKGLECIGRELAKEQNIKWREYWDFLDEFVDIAASIGLQKFENYLKQRQRTEDMNRITAMHLDALEKFRYASGNVNEEKRYEKHDYDENGLKGNKVQHSPLIFNTSMTHQMPTPFIYVEKSLQVHAKRMTKILIHSMGKVMSINDPLLLELKRVKWLIYSFKEDADFLNVNFQKVHSRIGNLVSIYLRSSQELTKATKNKILIILQNLLQTTSGEGREHMHCMCARIQYMLESKMEHILLENVKNEETCSRIWSQEKECNCQLENNVSHKTSRRNRLEGRFKNNEHLNQYEMNKESIKQTSDRRRRNTYPNNDSSNDIDEEVFWADIGSDVDSDNEDQETWYTPPESPSCIDMSVVNIKETEHKIFIYGNEPTKRDMDVLNAVLFIHIDKSKYPNIHSWKDALIRYRLEEIGCFQSPYILKKKSHATVIQSSYKNIAEIPSSCQYNQYILAYSPNTSQTINSLKSSEDIVKKSNIQLPSVKCLFMSPKIITTASTVDDTLNTITTTTTAINSIGDTTTTSTVTIANTTMSTGLAAVNAAPSQYQRPLTPINKLRGLFSAYRERLDNSPLSTPITGKSTHHQK